MYVYDVGTFNVCLTCAYKCLNFNIIFKYAPGVLGSIRFSFIILRER